MANNKLPHDQSFRPDIQGLRAIALMLVLFFHSGIGLSGGYVGVDVFFVLSGFLITGLLVREGEKAGRIGFVDFYAKRFKRLLPAATLVLVATSIATYFWGPRGELDEFGLDGVFAAGYLVNWRFADRAVDYLAEDVGRSPFLHFWSLSVEEQFYFVWPVLIAFGIWFARRFHRPLFPTLGGILLLVLLPTFLFSALADSDAESFFTTTTRLWELALGAYLTLARALLARIPRNLGGAISILGLVFIAAACAMFGETTPWPSSRALLPTVGAALALTGGQVNPTSFVARILSTRPAQAIGAVSYSVYLWHWPFLVVGQDWFHLEGPLWGTVLCAASVVPATLSYLYIEQPVRYSRALTEQPNFALSIGTSLSLLAVAAGLTVALGGASEQTAANAPPVSVTRKEDKVVVHPERAGALSLGRKPTRSKHGIPLSNYPPFYPPPERAHKDVPSPYAKHCQTPDGRTHISWCKLGDLSSKRRFVLAGDSLILQYADALDAIGQARGWRIETATKSSCSFSETADHAADCRRFNENVLAAFHAKPPEVVFTNQHGRGDSKALIPYWSELRRLGIKVVVIGANPRPPLARSVYQCLLEHSSDYTPCAFSRAEGLARSALSAQKQAAAELEGVHVIDLTDYICPRETCAPVIGNVLVFRQGSHITNSYAKSLAPILAKKFDELNL